MAGLQFGFGCARRSRLQAKYFLHLFADFGESSHVTAWNFRGRPAGEPDLVQRLSDIAPRQVTGTDVGEFVVQPAEPFDIQFHGSPAERTEPLAHLAIFPVVTQIVIHADPGTVEAVDKIDKPLRCLFGRSVVVVEHVVPDILDQNHLAQCRGQWQQFLDFGVAPLGNFGFRSILGISDHDQHATAAGGVRYSNAVFDVGPSLGTHFFDRDWSGVFSSERD